MRFRVKLAAMRGKAAHFKTTACHGLRALAIGCALGLASMAQAQDLIPLLPLPEEDARQWPAIGRAFDPNNPGRGFCSGALIAPDLVLTAGHCAGGTASPDPAQQSLFQAGIFNSDAVAERRIIARTRHPAYKIDGQHRPDNDVGLWFLDSPITNITPLPLSTLDTNGPPDTLALLGYHRAVPFRLSGRKDCKHLGSGNGLTTVGCRVVSGNSGSPILQQTETGWEIVAVTSSQSGPNAIAVRLGNWLREAVQAHLATPD